MTKTRKISKTSKRKTMKGGSGLFSNIIQAAYEYGSETFKREGNKIKSQIMKTIPKSPYLKTCSEPNGPKQNTNVDNQIKIIEDQIKEQESLLSQYEEELASYQEKTTYRMVSKITDVMDNERIEDKLIEIQKIIDDDSFEAMSENDIIVSLEDLFRRLMKIYKDNIPSAGNRLQSGLQSGLQTISSIGANPSTQQNPQMEEFKNQVDRFNTILKSLEEKVKFTPSEASLPLSTLPLSEPQPPITDEVTVAT
jgi:hypothetical protein